MATSATTQRHIAPGTGAPDTRLEMEGVTKTFGRITVLRDVSLTVHQGEVHALLGQNGSGKSTLIKVLSGLHRPDPGARIRVDEVDVEQPITPAAIMNLGLNFVHQSLGLIPGHSVTENIRLGTLRRRKYGALIDWTYEREQALATLERLNADIDPDLLVDHLHMGERAEVAIARALQSIVPGQGCVVLDESTQSLPREMLPEFYQTVRNLAEAGTSVLIVSHRLDEVLALADRVTVLRDGAVVAAGLQVSGLSEASLAREILGKELDGFAKPSAEPVPWVDSPAARIRGACGRDLAGIDLDIRPGEILGVTGSTEAGHDELPYLLARWQSPGAGTLEIRGTTQRLGKQRVEGSSDYGVVLVPSDRLGAGLAVGETAVDNLTLPRLKGAGRKQWLRNAWQREEFLRAQKLLNISPPSPDLLVGSFSGGNQQKILLAKWLLHNPTLLVLHEPTQAVDVGARADILRAMNSAAAQGAAVLICSIEAQDLALVCDRVVVLHRGHIAQELTTPFTADEILEATP